MQLDLDSSVYKFGYCRKQLWKKWHNGERGIYPHTDKMMSSKKTKQWEGTRGVRMWFDKQDKCHINCSCVFVWLLLTLLIVWFNYEGDTRQKDKIPLLVLSLLKSQHILTSRKFRLCVRWTWFLLKRNGKTGQESNGPWPLIPLDIKQES